jgi:hypothetical protein
MRLLRAATVTDALAVAGVDANARNRPGAAMVLG